MVFQLWSFGRRIPIFYPAGKSANITIIIHHPVKNQYFGDINDYRKYGLLRILGAGKRNKIAVCWMLTADDSRGDGKFTGYLDNPNSWRSFDPELFDFLRNTVIKKRQRDIASVEQAGLVPSATFYSLLLTDENRSKYFQRLDKQLRRPCLLFFDPDNGMEVQSIPRGRRGSNKYLYWHEAVHFFSNGHSLLIYQHYPRMERERFTILRAADFIKKMGAATVYSFKTPKVVFFLVPQQRDEEFYRSIVEKVDRVWGGELVPGEYHTSHKRMNGKYIL